MGNWICFYCYQEHHVLRHYIYSLLLKNKRELKVLSNLTRVCVCVCAQSCLTFCDPMDYSLPGSSVHEIFQIRIPERVAISYSRGSSGSRDQTCISCIGRQILYHCTTWEAHDNTQEMPFLIRCIAVIHLIFLGMGQSHNLK